MRHPIVNRKVSRGQPRRGGAMVELAVCLPVIVLIIFASLEGANLLFVRQAAVQAAYETVKSIVKTNGTVENARQLGSQVLAARNINQHSITISPNNAASLAKGTPVVVEVQVESRSRNIIGIGPFRNLTIRAQATMAKE